MTAGNSTDTANFREGIGKFRPDIEGLRGIAITLVALAHAGVPGFAGGFIGVDIFFVISGYLITGLLMRELEQTSRIDFFAFYARRVRRLIPAFAAMIVCVVPVILWFFRGGDLKLQAASGMWATLWSSNIYFALAHFNYFDASARDSFFLHTWSLGVEEQFYVVWPALLYFTWRVSHRPDRTISRLILGVTGLGFVACAVGTLVWPVAAYYLMPFRLWELAAGGFCFVFVRRRQSSEPLLRVVGSCGVAAIVAACLFLDAHSVYPGSWVLLPVVGSALVIAAGEADGFWFSRLLNLSLVRFVGRISYAWYLWHWPALLFVRKLGCSDLRCAILALAASFVLAAVSYGIIERNLGRRRIHDTRLVTAAGVAAAAVLALGTQVSMRLTSTRSDVSSPESRIRRMVSVPSIYSMAGCDEWYSSSRLVPCEFDFGGKGRPVIVLLGDSMALHLFPAFESLFAERKWNLVVLTKSSCPMVDEPFFYERIHRRFTECETWRNEAIDYVLQTHPELVFIGSAGSYPFDATQWQQGTHRIVERLLEGTKHVAVLSPTPRLPFDGPTCASSSVDAIFSSDLPSQCNAKLADIEDTVAAHSIKNALEGLTGAELIDLNGDICPAGICYAVRQRQLVFRDSQHLNGDFAATLKDALAAKLGSALLAGEPKHGESAQ